MSKTRSNHLRLARARLGYEQKQIVSLLGHKTTPPYSRVETGLKTPSLKVALKLSLLYRLPIRVLFFAYFEECRQELSDRADKLRQNPSFRLDVTEPTDHCSYSEMMNASLLTEMDKKKIQRHVVDLMTERRKHILGD